MRLRHPVSRLLVAAAVWSMSALAMAQPAADDGWITVQAGRAFRFEAPGDLKAIPVSGIDSFVGRYESARFGLQFDYGAYSNDLRDLRQDPRFEVETAMIDGREAVILTGPGEKPDDCAFETHVYVVVRRGAPPPVALTMDACANGYAGVVQLHRLFMSLRFNPPGP